MGGWGGGICPGNHWVFLAQMTKKFVYLQSSSHSLLEILLGSPLLHPNFAPSNPEPSTQVPTFLLSCLSHLCLPDCSPGSTDPPFPSTSDLLWLLTALLSYFLCLLRN